MPGPDETAQTFETVAPVDARVEHNAIAAQTRIPQEIAFGQTELYLAGTDHRLAPGDAILVVGAERASFVTGENWDVRVLSAVEPDDVRGHTRIAWREGLGKEDPHVEPAQADVEVHVFRRRAALFGHNAPDARLLSTNGTNLEAVANVTTGTWDDFEITGQAIDLDQPYEKVVPGSWIALADDTVSARTQPSALGFVELYKARTVTHRSRTDYGLSSKITRVALDAREHLDWFGLRTTLVLAESERLPLAERPVLAPVLGDVLALDARYEELALGQAVAVSGARQHVRLRARRKDLELRVADGSRVDLEGGDRLALLAAPVRRLAGGTSESLDRRRARGRDRRPQPDGADLERARPRRAGGRAARRPGRAAARPRRRGRRADRRGRGRSPTPPTASSTTATARTCGSPRACATSTRARPSASTPTWPPATHGETVSEILGSGDASRPNQRFALKQLPLTYVRADTPTGRRSTLAVRVAETLWEERPTLFAARPARPRVHDRRPTTRRRPPSLFGDGVEGARLPTGDQNVRATYRKGTRRRRQRPRAAR